MMTARKVNRPEERSMGRWRREGGICRQQSRGEGEAVGSDQHEWNASSGGGGRVDYNESIFMHKYSGVHPIDA